MRLWNHLRRRGNLIGEHGIADAILSKEHPVWRDMMSATRTLCPQVLDDLSTKDVPAIESFDPAEHFVANVRRTVVNPVVDAAGIVHYLEGDAPPEVPIHWVSPEFKAAFGGLVERDIPASTLAARSVNSRNVSLTLVRCCLSEDCQVVPLIHVWAAMRLTRLNPPEGAKVEEWNANEKDKGMLSKRDGNYFFVQDAKGVVHLVKAVVVSLKKRDNYLRFTPAYRNSLMLDRAKGWHMSIVPPLPFERDYTMPHGVRFLESEVSFVRRNRLARAAAVVQS